MRNLETGFLKKVNYSRLHDMQTIEERVLYENLLLIR